MKSASMILFTLILINWYSIEAAKDLPARFPRCYRFDPDLNKCLLKATDQVRQFLVEGVPELNIPAIDPFLIPQIALEQGTQALNFKAILKNVLVRGLSKYKFSQFDFDVPNLQFTCKATLDSLLLEGDYTVNGKILIAPIEGSGKFKASIDNCNVTVYQTVAVVKRKGQDYIQPVMTNTSIEVGGPKATLDGLFEGNAELNKATNKVISDNVNILFEDLKPVIEEIVTRLVEDLLFKGLEDNVPFDKLYRKEKIAE